MAKLARDESLAERINAQFTIWGIITFAALILVGFWFWFISWILGRFN